MRKNFIIILVFFVYIFLRSAWYMLDKNVHITLCDVGQGDSILIRWKDKEVLIDAGRSEAVLECLSKNLHPLDTTLEVVIATHPDSDHIGGFEYVLKRYKVNQYISNGELGSTEVAKRVNTILSGQQTRVISMKSDDSFQIGPLHWLCIWPSGELMKKSDQLGQKINGIRVKSHSTNAASLVFRLEFGDFRGLFTGDLEIPEENILLTSGKVQPIDLLKVGHHGSNGSSSEALLQKTHPTFALISVGANNTYGHPSKRVIDMLFSLGATVYRTDRDGEVRLVTNGRTIWREHPML